MFFRLFALCSARVSSLVIVLIESMCERIGKWKTRPIFFFFERQIVNDRLAGTSVT
jgi:hypothetical protein